MIIAINQEVMAKCIISIHSLLSLCVCVCVCDDNNYNSNWFCTCALQMYRWNAAINFSFQWMIYFCVWPKTVNLGVKLFVWSVSQSPFTVLNKWFVYEKISMQFSLNRCANRHEMVDTSSYNRVIQRLWYQRRKTLGCLFIGEN